MAAPLTGEPEWVEIFNRADASLDLFRWSIGDGSGAVSDCVQEHILLEGGDYAVISEGALNYTVPEESPVITVGRFPSLNNDGDLVRLIGFDGSAADSMAYADATAGYSFELISPSLRGKPSGWDSSVDARGATPGRRNSIDFSHVSDDETLSENPRLSVTPNPFLDTATFSYRLPFPLARVRLYLYDRRGRLVAKIRDTEESGSEWTGIWDGRSSGSRLPAGPYILNLEALDKRSGKMYNERITVVLASKL
jgi:hypothetical protein